MNELEQMIADYMEKGFLDNIIDMFKHDKTLYPITAKLIKDERLRVRLGAIALIESLKEIDAEDLDVIADSIIPLLHDENPVIRGDTAHAIGIVGMKRHIEFLEKLLDDNNSDVRDAIKDSIEEIEHREVRS